MKIGKRIKDLRINFQFSQDTLADKIYVSRQTISNWENNKNYPMVSLAIVSFYYASRIEKLKKNYDIQTYKEITTFVEKKQLDNNEKNQEKGKRYYQKFLLAISAGIITLVVVYIMNMLIK